jgi:hypothetical protein
MQTTRFIAAFAELIASPFMLLCYGLAPRIATIAPLRQQPLDFSVIVR